MHSPFVDKALREFALSLLDWDTERNSFAGTAERLAARANFTPAELFGHLHPYLCSLMGLPRTLDVFGIPMLDIDIARETHPRTSRKRKARKRNQSRSSSARIDVTRRFRKRRSNVIDLSSARATKSLG